MNPRKENLKDRIKGFRTATIYDEWLGPTFEWHARHHPSMGMLQTVRYIELNRNNTITYIYIQLWNCTITWSRFNWNKAIAPPQNWWIHSQERRFLVDGVGDNNLREWKIRKCKWPLDKRDAWQHSGTSQHCSNSSGEAKERWKGSLGLIGSNSATDSSRARANRRSWDWASSSNSERYWTASLDLVVDWGEKQMKHDQKRNYKWDLDISVPFSYSSAIRMPIQYVLTQMHSAWFFEDFAHLRAITGFMRNTNERRQTTYS